MKKRPYIRTNAVTGPEGLEVSYDLMIEGQKIYEFEKAGDLHEFLCEAMGPLRWAFKGVDRLD